MMVAQSENYMKRATNKNWPSIIFFEMNGRASAIHFLLEHAGQNYNEDYITFDTWPVRKKDYGGNGPPLVVLPDGMVLGESLVQTIYYGKLFGYYPRDNMQAYTMEKIMAKFDDAFTKLG